MTRRPNRPEPERSYRPTRDELRIGAVVVVFFAVAAVLAWIAVQSADTLGYYWGLMPWSR